MMSVNEPPRVSSSSVLRRDVNYPFFSLEESHDKVIDIKASFVPGPIWCTGLIRIMFFFFAFGSTAYSFITNESKLFWFGYLTHWSAFYTITYMGLIMICTFYPSLVPQPEEGSRPNFLIRFLWVMYSVATVHEICITLLYWTLVYDGNLLYQSVVLHGVFVPLLLVDGFVLGKIPVRFKHVLFGQIAGLIWMIWSVVHSLTDFGISEEDRSDGDGDPLYDTLNWQDNTLSSTIIAGLVIFVLFPFVHWIVLLLSLYSPCCMYESGRRVKVSTDKAILASPLL